MMNIREYNGYKDFPVIRDWITDERTHAMWCANRTDFPLQKESFDLLLNDMAERFGDKPYVAVDGDGTIEGFSIPRIFMFLMILKESTFRWKKRNL